MAALALPALCAGCGQNAIGNNVVSLVMGQLGPGGPKLDRAYADKLPYASMSARLGGKDPALLVLARQQQRDLVWRAGREVVLVTRAGRLMQTGGLPGNIRQTWLRGTDPLEDRPHRLSGPVEFVRTLDIEAADSPIRTIDLRATLTPIGRQRITIYGTAFETIELAENNRAIGLDWSFTNRYWVDARTGLTWQSVQNVVPGVADMSLALLKPPQSELDAVARMPA